MTGITRQEFTDAVGEVLGLHPGVETQVDTITRLADLYAAHLIALPAPPPEEDRRGQG